MVKKNLCNIHRVNFLAIQETKCVHFDLWSIRQLWGNEFFFYISLVVPLEVFLGAFYVFGIN